MLMLYDSGSNIEMKRGYGSKYPISVNKAERSIDQIARSNKLEDAWLHYRDTLTDVGYNETAQNVEVYIDEKFKPHGGKTIILYHTHPKEKDIYPPSPPDIIFHDILSRTFPSNNVISRMLDGRGVWEYDVDEKLSKELHEITLFSPHNIEEYLREKIEKTYDSINSKPDTIPYTYKNRKEHIELMKAVGVKLTYRKMEFFQNPFK
ncbi:MAG TPA: hypothetical protein VEC16_05755 [Alphaproteobacteria bacterium]|nr:hypothetical protein [Alphaproteobacteria bacterium]